MWQPFTYAHRIAELPYDPGLLAPPIPTKGQPWVCILAPLVKTVSSPSTGAHMVLSLPVSTTSYSRHAVSTVQTRSARPTTVRSLIDTGGGLFSIHSTSITNPSPPGLHFSFLLLKDSFFRNFSIRNKTYLSRVTGITRLLTGLLKHSSANDNWTSKDTGYPRLCMYGSNQILERKWTILYI